MNNNFIINYAAEAKKDLYDIIFYIAEELENKQAAKNLHEDIIKTINNLATYPYSAPITKYSAISIFGVRQITIKNYCIFYYPDKDKKQILILRIKYAKEDFNNLKI